jgi:polyribonucleotide 5'-hydroxyl-kinase
MAGLSNIVSAVNILLVLGSERLYSDMLRRFDGTKTSNDEDITVIKLSKSGGCVDRDEGFLKQVRQASIREYFFGEPNRTLSPHTQQVDFGQLLVYKITECRLLPLDYPRRGAWIKPMC